MKGKLPKWFNYGKFPDPKSFPDEPQGSNGPEEPGDPEDPDSTTEPVNSEPTNMEPTNTESASTEPSKSASSSSCSQTAFSNCDVSRFVSNSVTQDSTSCTTTSACSGNPITKITATTWSCSQKTFQDCKGTAFITGSGVTSFATACSSTTECSGTALTSITTITSSAIPDATAIWHYEDQPLENFKDCYWSAAGTNGFPELSKLLACEGRTMSPSSSSSLTPNTPVSTTVDSTQSISSSQGSVSNTQGTQTSTESSTTSSPAATSGPAPPGYIFIVADVPTDTSNNTLEWYILDYQEGNTSVTCEQTSFVSYWTTTFDRSKSIPMPGGEKDIVISSAGELCSYKNSGDNLGRLFCPSGEFACDAQSGELDCGIRKRYLEIECPYHGLGTVRPSSASSQGPQPSPTSTSPSQTSTSPQPPKALEIFAAFVKEPVVNDEWTGQGGLTFNFNDLDNNTNPGCGDKPVTNGIGEVDNHGIFTLGGQFPMNLAAGNCAYYNNGQSPGRLFCGEDPNKRDIPCNLLPAYNETICPNSFLYPVYSCPY